MEYWFQTARTSWTTTKSWSWVWSGRSFCTTRSRWAGRNTTRTARSRTTRPKPSCSTGSAPVCLECPSPTSPLTGTTDSLSEHWFVAFLFLATWQLDNSHIFTSGECHLSWFSPRLAIVDTRQGTREHAKGHGWGTGQIGHRSGKR